MKKPSDDMALAFRDQLLRTARKVRAGTPLRILVKREVPLTRENQPLGHLDLLLRLSFKGEGQGIGVLVFEWPGTAKDHSAVRLLQAWSDRCGQAGTCQHGVLELESRPATLPGVHFKVRFSVSEVPDELLELFELAARTGLLDAASEEIARALKPAPAHPTAASNGQDQARVDTIAHNAVFDPEVHPRVNPNEEVRKSDGATFRLVMKRLGGRPTRVWLHVSGG